MNFQEAVLLVRTLTTALWTDEQALVIAEHLSIPPELPWSRHWTALPIADEASHISLENQSFNPRSYPISLVDADQQALDVRFKPRISPLDIDNRKQKFSGLYLELVLIENHQVIYDGVLGKPQEGKAALAMWRTRAWSPYSRIYAEWHNGEFSVRGFSLPDQLTKDEKKNEWTQAKRVLALLHEQNRAGGRPEGTKDKNKYPTSESYVEGIHELYKRAERSVWGLAQATDEQLAKWLRISKHTMYLREKQYGITPDDIRAKRV
jgi:hypothetical protein